MIHAYADTSVDDPIASVGFVLLRSERGDEELLETGTRVLNMESAEVPVRSSHTGEYYAAIVAARAALSYTAEPIIVHLDCQDVAAAMKHRTWDHEPYFPHALFSFLERFEDYYIHQVHRENNKHAHEQARVGLKIGRDMYEEHW